MPFLDQQEIKKLNLKFVGNNVKISDKVVFYNPEKIEIDDNTRIDDFSILSASEHGIKIGKFVHIAAFCSLQGAERIELEDFSGLSSKVAIYSSSDDYSGRFMTNPTVDKEFTAVNSSPVLIKKHSIIGFNACILPGVVIGKGSAVGAFSLVNKSIPDSVIVVGVPAVEKSSRKKDIFELEKLFMLKCK